MSKIKHRPEIDGLRAIAVLSVVFFHAGLGFAGGYVGVDVFFVISGFLITSLILSEMDGGTFGILDFWERRVRRILPALALVVVACIAAGWLMFIPTDFKKLGESVAAQSLLKSNLYFWRNTEYFTSNDAQPLLNTWTLAVEEQFYLLFPLFLLAMRRLGRRAIVGTMGVAALASLALSIRGTYADPNAAFYLLAYRAWELLLGSLLAALPEWRIPGKGLNECLSWGGLLAILGAAWFYDSDTRFPGAAALLPCLGAGLFIGTNAPGRTLAGRILSLKPVVFVGLISYSLYLWHWPVLIFSKYWALKPLSPYALAGALVGSLLLAIISWKFVETPFRRRLVLRGRVRIFAFGGCTLAALLLAGRLIEHEQGFRSRWGAAALQYIDGRKDQDYRIELDLAAARRGQFTGIGVGDAHRPIDWFIWGDSHAMALLHVLNVICSEADVRAVAATHSATAPLLNYPSTSTYALKGDAMAYNQAIVEFIRKRKIRNVLLVGAWSGYLPANSNQSARDRFSRSLAETLAALRRTGAKVFIMKDVPIQPFDVPRALALAVRRKVDISKLGTSESEYNARNGYEPRFRS
jgi:peptidoglycan/LPS O-acetylase OafA/YrhL